MDIERCIQTLRSEKAILKAENVHLTGDIRIMNALKIQQVALEAEMEKIVEDIHKRHARIEGPHRFAAKKARIVRKKAAQVEEERWAELKVAVGVIEPHIEVDEEGDVLLMLKYGDDSEKKTLFDTYTNAKSSYETLQAATTRLRQSRAELLDLGDFVSKVKTIAIGSVHIPHDR